MANSSTVSYITTYTYCLSPSYLHVFAISSVSPLSYLPSCIAWITLSTIRTKEALYMYTYVPKVPLYDLSDLICHKFVFFSPQVLT